MGMLKRRLAVLLAAAMLFTSAPFMEVTAAEDDGTPAVESTEDGSDEQEAAPVEETGDGETGDENNVAPPAEEGNTDPAEGNEGEEPAAGGEEAAPAEGGEGEDPAVEGEGDLPVDTTAEATDAVVKASALKIQLKGQDVESAKVNVGSTITLTVAADPEEAEIGEVTWESSDTSIATVSEDGVVKGVTGGKVTITATSVADSSLKAEIELTSYAGKWKKVNKKWKFVLPNGKYAKSVFVIIDGKKYYIGSDQYMKTGWFTVKKGYTYYANGSGVVQKGWLKLTVKEKISGKQKSVTRYYYTDPKSGVRKTGWQKIDGKFYYFASDGKNQKSTGWAKLSNAWYYMQKDDDSHIYAVTGWKEVKSKWYYLDPSDKLHGKMKTGWFTETISTATGEALDAEVAEEEAEEGEEITEDLEELTTTAEAEAAGTVTKTYYFNSSGASVLGVQTINKKKYLFVNEGGKGVLAEDGWTNVGSDWYYVNPADSVVATGQTEVDGEGYYFDPKTGVSKSGVIDLSTTTTTGTGKNKKTTTTYKLYYYKDNGSGKGILQKDTWIDDGANHYYAGSDGKLLSGDQEIGGKHYFFETKTGKAKGGIVKVNGESYLYADVDENGRPARVTTTGKFMYQNKPYFISETGALAVGFVKDGEDTYYYKSDFNIATGWQKDNGKWYYFDAETGKMQTGWFDDKGDPNKRCYLDPATGAAAVGAKTIDGAQYYFNSSCYMQKGVVAISGAYYAYDITTGQKVVGQAGKWEDEVGNVWKIDANGKITNYNKKLAAMDTKANSKDAGGGSHKYMILANKSTHILGVYQKTGGKWVRVKTWAFHSADNKTDAKTGKKHWTPESRSYVEKSIANRLANKAIGTNGVIQRDFDGSTGYYCTYIHSGYFIHTRLYSKGARLKTADYYKENKKPWKNGKQYGPLDPNLNDTNLTGGKNISHGCVRLNFNNALWVFKNVEKDSRVWTYH